MTIEAPEIVTQLKNPLKKSQETVAPKPIIKRKLHKTTLNILNYIDINPGASGYEIMKRQNIASGVLYPVLKRELSHGNLEIKESYSEERKRSRKGYFLTEYGQKTLIARKRI